MIEQVTRTFFIGVNGEEFKTEDEARYSLIKDRLADILRDASDPRDYSVARAAAYLWGGREEVVSLLGGQLVSEGTHE